MDGDKIKRLRQGRGLSRREFAEKLGVDEKTCYNWENDKTGKISKSHLRLIRETFFG